MKRNETVLVYAVTGLLLAILLVAVVFGNQTPVQSDADRSKTVQLPGVTPALMGAEEAPTASLEGALEDLGAVTDGDDVSGPEAADNPDETSDESSDEAGAVALSKPVPVPEPVVLPEQLLEQALGTSRRDGDYRIVTGWENATLRDVVERWTGTADAMAAVQTINETVGDQLVHGDEILVPWVDAEVLLVAKKARDAERQQADWVKGDLYVLKKGDSLWKVASRRVATNMIPAWLEQFKGLNPSIEDTSSLMEGQKVRLPR